MANMIVRPSNELASAHMFWSLRPGFYRIQMSRHKISDAHESINEIPTGPAKYLAKPLTREKLTGKEDPVELDSNLDIQLTYNKIFLMAQLLSHLFILSNRSNGAEYLNFLQTVAYS
jgi:hypothetical protein